MAGSKKGGLGRGLDALFADAVPVALKDKDTAVKTKKKDKEPQDEGEKVQYLSIHEVMPNEKQPRKVFDEEKNSLIPVAFSGYYFLENGYEAYDELVKQQVVYAGHPYLKKTRDETEKLMKPKDDPKTAFIGQQFTDLEMADPDGKLHKISELVGEGHWVLVDFWASWCGPCRAEMPNVVEAYNKYHDKGFEVVGVSFDNKKEAWVKAIGQLKMPWLQISDLKGWECAAAPIYKVDGIPDNILIDPQGKIVDRALRGKALQTRLQKIFASQ